MMGFLSQMLLRKQPEPGAVVPITEARAGVRLVVDSVLAENPMRSDRLASLGLVRGCEVILRQRRPAFVIDVGETTLALDGEIASGIRVRQA